MPFDTQTAARRALAETGNVADWKIDSGQVPTAVRFHFSMRQHSTHLLRDLRGLHHELLKIIDRIEREDTEPRRMFVAASELKQAAIRFGARTKFLK